MRHSGCRWRIARNTEIFLSYVWSKRIGFHESPYWISLLGQ